MSSFKSPPPFVPGNDPATAWCEYKEGYVIYATAAKLGLETVAIQRATFLHILGPAGRRILKTLPIVEIDDARTVQVILNAFDAYYKPYKNLLYSRYLFMTSVQQEHQTFDEFFTDLKAKAHECDLAPLTDTLITTLLVVGIRNEKLRKDLLARPNLTLNEAVTLCQAEETASAQADIMGASSKVPSNNAMPVQVDALKRKKFQKHPGRLESHSQSIPYKHNARRTAQRPNYPPRQRQQATLSSCPNCGTHHTGRPCPARYSECLGCHSRGHWRIKCRQIHALQETNPENDTPQHSYYEEYEYPQYTPREERHFPDQWEQQATDNGSDHNDQQEYLSYCLTLSTNQLVLPQLLTATIPEDYKRKEDEIYDQIYLEDHPVTFKLDTGSQVNIISKQMYDTLQFQAPLRPPKHTVTAYSGHIVPIIGTADLQCTSHATSTNCSFYVSAEDRTPILGAAASFQLGLIEHHRHPLGPPPRSINSINTKPTLPTPSKIISLTAEQIIQQYHTIFGDIGKIPGTYTIDLKPNAIPYISAAHKIPIALQKPVRAELERLLQSGVIVPVLEATDWVHPMVVVPKARNEVRICLDPRKLNKSIKRTPFPVPTSQEIFASLSGSTVFTVLDVQSAFWQIALDEQSSKLCTFATSEGQYRFRRLPMGISTGSEVCQAALRRIYPVSQFPEVYISTDDFLIATKDMTSHNESLIRILERALQTGLCFSRKKIQLAVSRISYIGHVITPEGVEIDPEKTKAIASLPPPENKAALQSFLGMINYIMKFIPHATEDTAPLRTLLKKDTIFKWEPSYQRHYDNLKKSATSAPVLAFFNPAKPITLSVDASQHGVGAVLLQDDHPIEYASTTFTPTQKRYAQIEKELLAIVFACEHFNYYMAGTKTTVQTDHNPLIGLLQKPLHQITPRLQRLTMRLFRYQFDLTYVPGKQLLIADMLSRAPQDNTLIDTANLEGPYAAVHEIVTLPDDVQRRYQLATQNDPIIQQIMTYIKEGWPKQQKALPQECKPYWPYQDELHTTQGLMFRGSRLVIPKTMQQELLCKVHATHQGINSCIAKAKLNIFWPNLIQDLTTFIHACTICASRHKANPPMMMTPHPTPSLPWEMVGTDLFQVGNQHYIILVDYLSHFVEVQQLSSTNSQAVINFLRPNFSRYGPPQKLLSDNGPPFNSHQFKLFMAEWGVSHVTSSPYYPQSNGLTERTIQTIKNSIIKAKLSGKDLSAVLLEYRTTPKHNRPSPAELSMGRRLRTPLTTTNNALKPHYPLQEARRKIIKQQQKMATNFNTRRTSPLPALHTNQAVYYWVGQRKWLQATIIAQGPEPRSYVIRTPEGQTLRRTRTHLRIDFSKPVATQPQRVQGNQPAHMNMEEGIRLVPTTTNGNPMGKYRNSPLLPAPTTQETPNSNPQQAKNQQPEELHDDRLHDDFRSREDRHSPELQDTENITTNLTPRQVLIRRTTPDPRNSPRKLDTHARRTTRSGRPIIPPKRFS